ncbi:hypothetical protein DFQ27_006709 [Actinomortierella ambigua]|uniref:U6 small nuclear RNA (adenine-(43)-N(6))-methyltransferase n=1 Tax=Actinomortierella ambigua TaxID=1343610 RepID=A0A9P6PXE0_9FUNG|nr:hypothetical protein DFQ27_006709 [Actinomortierella ambigua]
MITYTFSAFVARSVRVLVDGRLQPVDDKLDISKYAGRGGIDFKNPKALRELTYCLLRKDFGVEVEFPLDSLCPTIPNRVNYVCWIEDLVGLERENVIGIDMYDQKQPAHLIFSFKIDDRSVEYALKNVARNHWQDRISIVKNLDADKTLPPELFTDPNQTYDFCMCNPPFFESDDDYLESLASKVEAPAATLSATDMELTTPGGEVQFVKKMIDESKKLQKRVRWYTSMLGKKSSVNAITAYLRECSILNFTVATFRQGQTFRWAVAWSHHSEHAPKSTWDSLSKNIKTLKQVLYIPLTGKEPDEVLSSVKTILESLDIAFHDVDDDAEEASSSHALRGDAYSHTWSRAARRAKARQAQAPSDSSPPLPSLTPSVVTEGNRQEPILGFGLEVCSTNPLSVRDQQHPAKKQRAESSSSRDTTEGEKGKSTTTVEVSWLVGKDRELFESFVKHLRSRLEDRQQS